MKPKYKRVLLKVSGESLAGENKFGIDTPTIRRIAEQIKEVYDLGVEIAVVVGGGNFWRGPKTILGRTVQLYDIYMPCEYFTIWQILAHG